MASAKPSSLVDTRVIYCGDNLEQLQKLPAACVDLIYIDPPFNSNRNYESASPARIFWGETKEKRSFEDRHESTKAYIDYTRPRCVELTRVLKKTGSFDGSGKLLRFLGDHIVNDHIHLYVKIHAERKPVGNVA
ncbi:MAG: DNA methyltransferase [Verrucomicrobia bacterium]|nr:DNA methyltransferase [Verrucomicrobiota bacterium]